MRLETVVYGLKVDERRKCLEFVAIPPRRDALRKLGRVDFEQLAKNRRDCFPPDDPQEKLPLMPRHMEEAVEKEFVTNVKIMRAGDAIFWRDDRRGEYRHPEFPKCAFKRARVPQGEQDVMPGAHLLVCYDVAQPGKVHAASALVKRFETMYGECEITTVCVNPTLRGKGVCKEFIRSVVAHYLDNPDVYPQMREVKIYCERSNPWACACYAKALPAHRVRRLDWTLYSAFVYNGTQRPRRR